MKEDIRVSIVRNLDQLQSRGDTAADVWLAEVADTIRSGLPNDSQLVTQIRDLQKEVAGGGLSEAKLKALEEKGRSIIGAARRVIGINSVGSLSEGMQGAIEATITNEYFRSSGFKVTRFLVVLALVAAIGGPVWTGVNIRNAQDRIAEQERNFDDRLIRIGERAKEEARRIVQDSKTQAAEAEGKLDDLLRSANDLFERKGLEKLDEITAALSELSGELERLKEDERWSAIEEGLEASGEGLDHLAQTQDRAAELLKEAENLIQDSRWVTVNEALDRATTLPSLERLTEIEQISKRAEAIEGSLTTIETSMTEMKADAGALREDSRWEAVEAALAKTDDLPTEAQWDLLEDVKLKSSEIDGMILAAQSTSNSAATAANALADNVDRTREAVDALLSDTNKLLESVGRRPDQMVGVANWWPIAASVVWLEPRVGGETAATAIVFATIVVILALIVAGLIGGGSMWGVRQFRLMKAKRVRAQSESDN